MHGKSIAIGSLLWGGFLTTSPSALATAPDEPIRLDLPDSTAVLVVRAPRGPRTADPAHVELGPVLIAARDGGSLAELGSLLPATRVGVNSRGEALFMVRGGSERHVQCYLEGIPLNVPWDERADLSQVPIDAIARISAVRGVGSVLSGPNALAGTVQLHPRRRRLDGWSAGCAAQAGEMCSATGSAFYDLRSGAWSCLTALAYRTRAGIATPEGFAPAHHQPDRDLRTNTDLDQATLLCRIEHTFTGGGALRLTLQGLDGSKGVAPEAYRAKARFWRYPLLRRGLAGLSFERPWGRARQWRLECNASLDRFQQEIRAFDDSTYTTPVLEPGADYETDCDVTGYLQARVTRTLPKRGSLALQGVLRYSRHRESLAYEGPTEDYVQRLGALTTELVFAGDGPWEWRGGAGLEMADTPETGDKPSREATRALVAHTRLTRQFGGRAQLHLALSRRSRFPSLREMFSGALGKFVPNPDLNPELQDFAECGGLLRSGRGQLGMTAFISLLDGGIEKVPVPGNSDQFQRVNLDRIRILGAEWIAALRLPGRVSIAAHHTLLHARARSDGRWDRRIEDRPAYLSVLALAWQSPFDLRLRLEGTLTGRRHSADATDEIDGLRELPAQQAWNARVAHIMYPRAGRLEQLELFVRLNNLTDAEVDDQLGLPGAGRTLYGGIKCLFGT